MLFDSGAGLLRVLIVSAFAYAGLVLILRLAGKRALAKLNAFDFVVTVAFGSTFATVLLSKDVPLDEGLLAFAMLAAMQWLVSRLSIASPEFKKAVRSRPTLLVRDGAYLQSNLDRERVTVSEVEEAARKAGIGRLEDVAAVVMETDGSLSVIRRSGQQMTLLNDVRE